MNRITYYAHSRADDPDTANWQELESHLRGVAQTAARFAKGFQSEEWGYVAGLWHDLGKYQSQFQARLRGDRVSVEHSGAGARLAFEKNKEHGIPLAFIIAGHHSGLANLMAAAGDRPTPLWERLKINEASLRCFMSSIPPPLIERRVPELPGFLQRSGARAAIDQGAMRRRSEFWIRVLFSALVDADWLDTEAFLDLGKASKRGGFAAIGVLRQRLDEFIDQRVGSLSPELRSSSINRARAEVLASCRRMATRPTGVFSLTVPTGGGKTLSAMSFALRHAEHNGQQRVIVVIPYTSIIEQNAEVYREALGPDEVVEHHSSIDPSTQGTRIGTEATERHQLACENWDARVVVTTTVQFFESLFANRTSRCRKLHNVCGSVIVLDEVQTLPPPHLLAILDGLSELVEHYRCSVVLSTATPPALAYRPRFEVGLRNIQQIIAAPGALAVQLKRVRYHWPALDGEPVTWIELASELVQHRQVLAVVHKRTDAQALATEVQKASPDTKTFHLSALMCPAHRSDVLREIKSNLKEKKSCRVVSTQLVEAGVDIDFPVVYRSLGGLDSIVQAAGRCNREGTREQGQVVIFRAPTAPPRGTPARGLEITAALLQEAGGNLDPDDPVIFEKYFRLLYMTASLDAQGVQAEREQFNFATVAEKFQLIEDGFTKAVVVPYGDSDRRLAEVLRFGMTRRLLRQLQPFTVNIYPDSFDRLIYAGALEEVCTGVYAFTQPFKHLYDVGFGLLAGTQQQPDPAALVI